MLVLAVIFVGLLLTPLPDPPIRNPTAAAATPGAAPADALTQYGFRLTESAKAAGLDFVHGAPTLDPKLAHIMPQVASMGAAVSVVDVDRDGLPDLYVTDSKEGSRNRLFRNRGDGTFEDIAGAAGRRRPQPRRDRRVDGRASGATTTTTASRICSSIAGAVRSSFTTIAGSGFTRVTEARGPAGLGQRQHRRLARLRSRRPARSVRRRLLPRIGEPVEARRHAHDAGELRVREQRRPEVSVPESRRRTIRGSQRAGRDWRRGAGRWRRSPPICAAPAIPTSSSPTTTASRSCSPTTAAASARSAATPASATRRRAG